MTHRNVSLFISLCLFVNSMENSNCKGNDSISGHEMTHFITYLTCGWCVGVCVGRVGVCVGRKRMRSLRCRKINQYFY